MGARGPCGQFLPNEYNCIRLCELEGGDSRSMFKYAFRQDTLVASRRNLTWAQPESQRFSSGDHSDEENMLTTAMFVFADYSSVVAQLPS